MMRDLKNEPKHPSIGTVGGSKSNVLLHNYRRSLFTMALCLSAMMASPAVAIAKTVVVVRGLYELDDLTRVIPHSDADAKVIADKVAAVAEVNGWTVVRNDTKCDQRDCLQRARGSADEAICIAVKQLGEDYDFKLISANGHEIAAQLLGTSKEALDQVEQLTLQTLANGEAQPQPGPPEPTSPADAGTMPEEPEPEPQEPDDDGLSPTPFWVSLGVTGVLAISWGVVEGIGYSKLETYSEKDQQDRTTAEREKVKNFKIGSTVLLCVAGASAATTMVLLFLTDFHKKKDRNVSFAPSIMNGGGSLMVQGSF